ncbi:hypothetical protein FB451DRAFT_1568729 [Mycena latifolia]|nr:hypothetical protein FB451DRAFT_1568729 [Mycena latifolia]
MPPSFPSNSPTGRQEGGGVWASPGLPSWVPYSPQGALSPLSAPALHLLQPPPAPRLRTVPLPRTSTARTSLPAVVTARDLFPIDLSRDLDLRLLARAITNYRIPPRTAIDVLPTSRDRALIQLDSGRRPTTAVAVVRSLHSLMRAPLSLEVYESDLAPEVQRSVCEYFLAHSGPDGRRLWRDFLDGYDHPRGPMGAVLLQGHFNLWGFSQDNHLRWVMNVGPGSWAASPYNSW